MSSSPTRVIPKQADSAIVAFFRKLAEEHGATDFYLRVQGSTTNLSFSDDDRPLLKQIEAANKTAIATAAISFRNNNNNQAPSFSVRFMRGQFRPGPNSNLVLTPSLHADSIQIDNPERAAIETAIQINNFIDEMFLPAGDYGLEDREASSDFQSLVETHHQLITELHRQALALTEKFTSERLRLENELFERKNQINAEQLQAKEILAAEHAEKIAYLTVQEEQIAAERKRLDDRSNTHARREIREQIKKNLESYKKQFALTQTTKNLRTPIHICVATVEVACVAMIMFWSTNFAQLGEWDRVFAAAKTVGITFFAGAIIIWYLKWLNEWSSKHADTEFQLKQLELDVDRASWVVETSFEWNNAKGTTIPEPLLDAISRNLFIGAERRNEPAPSAADTLASALIGESARIELNIGGHKIELDRKSAEKLKKAAGN